MASKTMETQNETLTSQKSGELKTTDVNILTEELSGCKSEDNKHVNRNIFFRPNGSKYGGEYNEHNQYSKDAQIWSDGSTYAGEFVNDLRHGQGKITWPNNETYEGTFFKDCRHGNGTYKWPDGTSYSGTFYMDKKQGYGSLTFSSGDKFEGLYVDDERAGPGVMSYTCGSQDVGLWRGENLIKLCSEIKAAFTIKSHPEFEFKPEDNIVYIDLTERDQTLDPVREILFPPPVLEYPPKLDLTHRISELFNCRLHPASLAVDKLAFDHVFFKNIPKVTGNEDKVIAWNATPDMIRLQKHVLKHSFGQSEVTVSIDSIIKLDRTEFRDRGPLEQQSEELIMAAGIGDAGKVEMLLNSGKVHPDISDCNGYTALIGAAVNCHIEVINILLNSGANVNKVSDEGCSALTAASVFYYPPEGFIYNIAESYMKAPQDEVSKDFQQEQQTGSSESQSKRDERVNQLNEINRTKSESKQNDRKRPELKQINRKKPEACQAAPSAGLKSVTMEETKQKTKTQVAVVSLEVGGERALEKMSECNDKHFKDVDTDSTIGDGMEEAGWESAEVDDPEEFESSKSLRNFHIDVTDQLIERWATQLSRNEMVVSREGFKTSEEGKARKLAVHIFQRQRMKDTLNLLLRRGADPNVSCVPLPVLLLAVKSADVEMVRLLLMKGANPNVRMNSEKGGIYPLHIACALPGHQGVQITELLLQALADPNVRAEEDDSFLNHFLEGDWSKDVISEEATALHGGKTPLQIACSRDDNYKDVYSIVKLLLERKANTNLTCNGFSPLALAISSGNDLAVDELLMSGADPSLPLTHGLGNALCVAISTQNEHRRTLQGRQQLIEKLVKAGADMFAPVPIGPKRIMGTVVDYVHYVYNQMSSSGITQELKIRSFMLVLKDRRIAHVPYHALTPAERETYNARRQLLTQVGEMTRQQAVEREKRRNLEEEKTGKRSQSPSANFLYTGAGAKIPTVSRSKSASKTGQGQVKFESSANGEVEERKPLFKYCYECGRSAGVRLTACTRCKEVYYCSNACKLQAWNTRHKTECVRVSGRSRSPSAKNKTQVPGSATVRDKKNKDTTNFHKTIQMKDPAKDSEDEKKQGNHKFRTGSPPNYEYVYIDNYSHN